MINSDWKWPVFIILILSLRRGGPPPGWKIVCKNYERTFSFSFIWMVLYIYLFGPSLIQNLFLLHWLLIFWVIYVFGKSRSVYKVCRYFFSVCRQKSFLIYDAENWDRIKMNEDYFRYCCIFRKKGCFYWNLTIFACKFYLLYICR